MRIAIMGAGGVGSYFGARLAGSGEDVTFIARGQHLTALRERGISVKSPHGDLRLETVAATDDPTTVGHVDVVLVTVKLYDLDNACTVIAPMVGPTTMIVPVQNGVSAVDIICSRFDHRHVVGGLVFVASFVVAPGEVEHKTELHRLVFGEMDGTLSDRVLAFRDAGQRAGFDAEASENVESELWRKFALLGGISPVTSLSRQPVGAITADENLHEVARQSIAEVVAVGRAKGVVLAPDLVEATLALNARYDPDAKNSMLLDLEAGKPLEHEWLSGEIVRLGRQIGIPTPFHEIAYALLKPFAAGNDRDR
jgi:2-dehydropantoate 2-reductase